MLSALIFSIGLNITLIGVILGYKWKAGNREDVILELMAKLAVGVGTIFMFGGSWLPWLMNT